MILHDRNQLKKFVEYYTTHSDFTERSETDHFWKWLIYDILKIKEDHFFKREESSQNDSGHTNFADVLIPSTCVLIEMKGPNKNLDENILQSDGSKLTPYQQAKRYAFSLEYNKDYDKFKWIVTCNFKEIWIYKTGTEHPDPIKIKIEELWVPRWGSGKEDKEFERLYFLVDPKDSNVEGTPFASEKSAREIGDIYHTIRAKEKDPEFLRKLTIFCVRYIFCLYCANSKLFDEWLLRDYIQDNKNTNYALEKLFQWLNMTIEERTNSTERLDEQLLGLERFPYIDGGLFEEKIEYPKSEFNFSELTQGKLVANAIDVDWASINPVIFGSMFESTLESTERHDGGMHYTSEDNIKKVIKPLFFDELSSEHDRILEEPVSDIRNKKLLEFQEKIARLKFLDPACGSGNFLSLTYILLRELENKILGELLSSGVPASGLEIKVKLENFYGIEISEFATAVAKISMWIADHKMLQSTPEPIRQKIDYFPLKTYPHITKANALRVDWRSICGEVDYIMGNPPFLGGMMMNKTQKKELWDVIGEDVWGVGEMDYVAGWYYKTIQYIQGTKVQCGFVSTNSICQGQQAVAVWKPLIEKGIKINFGYHTFKWFSKSEDMAQVHVIIVGFAVFDREEKMLYDVFLRKENEDIIENIKQVKVDNINSYLVDAPNGLIENRSKPLCDVPPMKFGSMPRDGGNLILTEEEREEFIKKDPKTEKWIHLYLGAREFINNKKRYCLWLIDAKPNDIKSHPLIYDRVKKVRKFRLASKAEATRRYGNAPSVFCQIAQPDCDFLLVPAVSSENREYIPMGFLKHNVIASDATLIIPNCDLYTFAILTSSVHMAWMRAVCGRLKSDYRYSKDIVYNNFPWPTVTDAQKEKISQCGQKILDARDETPDSSFATLYDDATMPPNLRKAHRENDLAVMEAYGFNENMTEAEIVAELLKMYKEIVG